MQMVIKMADSTKHNRDIYNHLIHTKFARILISENDLYIRVIE